MLNSGSKMNAITLAYTAQLGIKVRKTNIGAQKINKSLLKTYSIVIAAFQVLDKFGHFCFFEKPFLLANISMKVVLGMPFLTFRNTDIQFAETKFILGIYTTKKVLLTTCQVELIDRKEIAKAALDKNIKAFMVHVSSLRLRMTIYPAKKVQMALLLAKKITVLVKYLDFTDVFLEKSANVFSKQAEINDHVIN